MLPWAWVLSRVTSSGAPSGIRFPFRPDAARKGHSGAVRVIVPVLGSDARNGQLPGSHRHRNGVLHRGIIGVVRGKYHRTACVFHRGNDLGSFPGIGALPLLVAAGEDAFPQGFAIGERPGFGPGHGVGLGIGRAGDLQRTGLLFPQTVVHAVKSEVVIFQREYNVIAAGVHRGGRRSVLLIADGVVTLPDGQPRDSGVHRHLCLFLPGVIFMPGIAHGAGHRGFGDDSGDSAVRPGRKPVAVTAVTVQVQGYSPALAAGKVWTEVSPRSCPSASYHW